jgi:hypothetical protein
MPLLTELENIIFGLVTTNIPLLTELRHPLPGDDEQRLTIHTLSVASAIFQLR